MAFSNSVRYPYTNPCGGLRAAATPKELNCMSITAKKVEHHFTDLNIVITNLLQQTGYVQHNELTISSTEDSANDRFFQEEYTRLLEKLDDMKGKIEYLQRPILAEATLMINKNGRYELDSENELTSGHPIEFLYYDDFYQCETWIASRVEHSTDYYIFEYPDVPLEGLKVRIR